MSGRPRVAFDTAIVLRALIFNNAESKRMRAAWQTGQCQALIGSGTARALMKSLAFPAFKLDEAQQLELLADFLPYAEVVDDKADVGLGKSASPVAALAIACAASLDYLVSDCPKLRGDLARRVKSSKRVGIGCLGSEEFLSRL
ncbi:PIN domain-containing protein [Roseateles oligotrophus]|uniref:PIN domain-containing protein n=1 Tax=Roseateles oligotrophus TaxID=1769250 RepID=A0ABT2YM46_9BURK|nr:PIN domain-containing protein [Roseateles oligotrophus]MCV2371128.1 PIN domain-containing protein [Roseateles oligotrophus]